MRVLFDVTHPADAHLFKHLIWKLQRDGHDVLVTAREKDVTGQLLDALGIEHECISRMGRGLGRMAWELAVRNWRLWLIARRFRPDVMMARIGISIGMVGRVLNVPRVIIEDTEHARLQLALSIPFATRICTGAGYLKDFGERQVRFRGPPVLAYLAPKYYTPDPAPLRRAGVDPDRPYIVLRVVSWAAAHDAGYQGLTDADIAAMVSRLSRFARVYISSERPLPSGLSAHQSRVGVAHMHDLLAFASLFVGESPTMAAEAAVLGTPSVLCYPLRTGYVLALEKEYQLLRNCDRLAEGIEIAEELLCQPDLRETWKRHRSRMLSESDDVTEFLYEHLMAASGKWRRAGAVNG